MILYMIFFFFLIVVLYVHIYIYIYSNGDCKQIYISWFLRFSFIFSRLVRYIININMYVYVVDDGLR
jgi:hypothetical protein